MIYSSVISGLLACNDVTNAEKTQLSRLFPDSLAADGPTSYRHLVVTWYLLRAQGHPGVAIITTILYRVYPEYKGLELLYEPGTLQLAPAEKASAANKAAPNTEADFADLF